MTEISLTCGISHGSHGPDGMPTQAAMYRLMVENTIDVIIHYNASLQRLYVSPSSLEVFGYDLDEMIGSSAAAMIHPDDFPRCDPLFRQVGPARPSLQLSFRVLRKDNVYIWVEGQYRYLPGGRGSVAVLRDVTAQKQAEDLLADANKKLETANQMLQAMAHRDGLTGLLNRRHFDELVEAEFARARRHGSPLAVLLLDVDFFKAYNDRYGHPAGDECLCRISRAIESAMRRPGDFAARFGGEEFVVVLPVTDYSGAVDAAERIRTVIAEMKIEHLGSVFGIVTVSIGVSSLIAPHDDEASSDLVNSADHALYQAKSDGRNRVVAWLFPRCIQLEDGMSAVSTSTDQPCLVLGLS